MKSAGKKLFSYKFFLLNFRFCVLKSWRFQEIFILNKLCDIVHGFCYNCDQKFNLKNCIPQVRMLFSTDLSVQLILKTWCGKCYCS